MRKLRAFTLIEVLVVVSIIALLMAIMMPSLREVRRLSRRTVCQKNLEQINTGIQAYLMNNTPKDTFPYACRLPSWEQQAASQENRRPLPSLPEILAKELSANKNVRATNLGDTRFRTNEVFCCPADRNTMAREGDPDIEPGEGIPTDRYFDHEGTSYEWESTLNGTKLDFKLIRLYGRVGKDDARTRKIELAKLYKNQMWMLFDFEAFHGGPTMRGSHNVLYTDGHVESDKWDANKRVGTALE
ncbi:MAG TPA: type II secretion system protein [Phycisphaerae bacterium]|nr:type II secretion system protein [Phycisphaerae bacterium]HOJ73449.1 type II secretion system protein [Phycisphaerae bacterium]HOM51058.1 type II secretion system protein [Phycisphaerae bacterium]HON67182.1 type II secretion system protein [Phycisphaerae bacterium]HOQ86579.1 type II secretion system protein [Phycisphaerae bacterium]